MNADILQDYIFGRLDGSEHRRVERAIRKHRDVTKTVTGLRRATEVVQATFTPIPHFEAAEFPRAWLELLKQCQDSSIQDHPSTEVIENASLQEPFTEVIGNVADRTKTWL